MATQNLIANALDNVLSQRKGSVGSKSDKSEKALSSDVLAPDEELDDPYVDIELINKHIDEAKDVDKFHRNLFERDWFRNILFDVGQQWVIYDGRGWRRKNLPAWYPRAQTNKFAEKKNDIVSALVQIGRIPIRYSPSKQDPESIATAEVGERFRDVLYEEAKIDDKLFELANWLVLTGNVFTLTYYDADEKHGKVSIKQLKCNACGAVVSAMDLESENAPCPECGGQGEKAANALTPFSPATDDEGNELTEEVPVGAICTDVISPFELRIDHRVKTLEEQRRFVRVKRHDLEWARQKWHDAERPDGMPVKIEPDGNTDLSQFYLDIISHATANYSGGGDMTASDSGSAKKERVTRYELYELPCEDFPEGLHAIRIGSTSGGIVIAEPLDSEYMAGAKKGQKFLPLEQFGFDCIPGRFWKKTRLDDIVPLQIFRNVVEANLRLTSQRMGNAIWLDPKGSGVEIITGEPGQRITYNPVSLGGTSFAKPERVEAALGNLQPLIMLINKIDDSIERVSGTFFLQGGDTPPGVTAASALAYLGERAQRSMSPLTREWAKGWKRWEEKALEFARKYWDDERIAVIVGRNKVWDVQTFKKADLAGSVNMDIDYAGLMPKSNATDRAEVGQLIQTGVINPQDPQQNYNILKLFGKTSLLGTVDLDTKEATKENEKFMSDGTQPQLLPMIQNSQIHMAVHADLCKTDEFKLLPPEQQQAMIAHIQAHMQDAVQYQQLMSQMAAASQGQPGPAGQMNPAQDAQNAQPAPPQQQPTPDIGANVTGGGGDMSGGEIPAPQDAAGIQAPV